MNKEKEEPKFWQSWMTIVVLLAVVVMVAWFNSQNPTMRPGENIKTGNGTHVPIGNGADVQTGNGADIQTGNVDTQVEKSTVVPMDGDTFFKTWIALSFGAINENLDCLSKASVFRNLVDIELCGKSLADNSNSSLRHMNEYANISTSMKTASDEYKKALENYNIGGANIAIGAHNNNLSQMSNAIGYIQNGTAHIKLVDKMLNDNNTTDGKFARSKIGTNTTGQ
jgi:hypothetical protein